MCPCRGPGDPAHRQPLRLGDLRWDPRIEYRLRGGFFTAGEVECVEPLGVRHELVVSSYFISGAMQAADRHVLLGTRVLAIEELHLRVSIATIRTRSGGA